MARNKYNKKKSNAQVKQYKSSLGEGKDGIEVTYEQDTSMLRGSDSFLSGSNRIVASKEDEPVAKMPIGLRIKDWLKNNAIEITITVILIPLLFWVLRSIIDIQQARGISEYRIEELESDLKDLSDNVPDKAVIEMEIENLKDCIDDLDTEELEKRIDRIEYIIESNNQ